MPKGTTRRWASLGDERLLDLRFCDLGLTVEGSALEPLVHELYAELDQRGLKLRPHVWASTEWFSPDGVPGIAVTRFSARDVVRHPLVQRIVEAYEREPKDPAK